LDKPNQYYINLIGTWMDLLIALWKAGKHKECIKVAEIINGGGMGVKVLQ